MGPIRPKHSTNRETSTHPLPILLFFFTRLSWNKELFVSFVEPDGAPFAVSFSFCVRKKQTVPSGFARLL